MPDPRLQLFLREVAGAGGEHALLFGQLIGKVERILPVEAGQIGLVPGAERGGVEAHRYLLVILTIS